MANKKIHPAWLMLAGSCAMIFVGLGIANSCAGLFYTSVSKELGIGIGSLSLYITIQGIANVLSVVFASRILPKCNIKLVTTIAALVICAAFGAMSQYHSVFYWYVSGAAIGLAIPFCGIPVAPVIVNNWFKKKQGLAMGIVMAFSGVGGVVLSPVIGSIIANSGWRTAYLVTGIIGAVVVLPFTLFVLKFKPSDMGVLPYGAEEGDTAALESKDVSDKELTGVTSRQAFKMGSFYLLFIAVFLMSGYNGVVQHIPGYAITSGFADNAGTVLSALMFTMMIGKILMGTIIDKFGIKTALVSAAAFCIAGLFVEIFSSTLALIIIGAGIFGLSAALVTVLPAMSTKELFGKKDYASIYSVITIASSLGANLIVPLLGYIYDSTKTYKVGFGLVISLVLISTVLYLITLINSKRKQANISLRV